MMSIRHMRGKRKLIVSSVVHSVVTITSVKMVTTVVKIAEEAAMMNITAKAVVPVMTEVISVRPAIFVRIVQRTMERTVRTVWSVVRSWTFVQHAESAKNVPETGVTAVTVVWNVLPMTMTTVQSVVPVVPWRFISVIVVFVNTV